MVSFEIRQLLKTIARYLTLLVLVAPTASFSQGELDTFAEREQQIVEGIEQEQTLNGPFSAELISPLMELSLLYDEIGALVRAEEAIREVMTVIRANDGLESIEQAPLIRRLISRETERGNAVAAWDLEQDLLILASRNPDDIRSAGILREAGDKRMDVLRRYDTGEIPPEIILGCFYDDSLRQEQAYKQGSYPMQSVRIGPGPANCTSGDRSQARRSLVESAQWHYRRALNVMFENGASSSNEIPELLMVLVRTSYLSSNVGLGVQSLNILLNYAVENSEGWLPQVEAHVLLADWDLLYASDLGTKYEDSALATYQQAYDLLIEHEISQEMIDEIFSPSIPITLPSFARNPLDSPETPESRGFIDVSFVITEAGKSKRIDVLDMTPNVVRAEERDLIRTIKYERFRPRVTDGRVAESEPIVVRYYLND